MILSWPRLRRTAAIPAEIRVRADLPRGEKVLASDATTDGSWLLGTRRSLLILTADDRVVVPWEEVEDVAWDMEGEQLRITSIGEFGAPRPSYTLATGEEPHLLLQLIRERVTASIVLQRRVPVAQDQDQRLGLTVIGRRSPSGGPVRWMHAYDEGLDPTSPEVVAAADLALVQAQAEVGDVI